MERLKHRADFVAAAAGRKASTPGFVLQARDRDDGKPARIGFTVSRKVGNAVERNRVRRRLREVVRLSDHTWIDIDRDYVLVGRRPALSRPFERLMDDFTGALRRVRAMDGARAEATRPNSGTDTNAKGETTPS